MVFNITYDLHQPGRDYRDLIAEIKKRDWCKVFESTWFVDTRETADQLCDRLRTKMDQNDNLLVMAAARPYQGWLDQRIWDWLNQRL